jgi:hypothetical protein
MAFQKFQIFPHNPLVLAYGFIVNRQVAIKTDRNSVILDPNPNILDQLYILLTSMNFYRFLKFSNFLSKFIGVSLGFYRKSTVCGKNWPELRIYWSWHPYSGSVIHNHHISEFLQVFKIFKILLKIHRC